MMTNHICIPGTNQRLYVGSIVVLNRLPNSKWVVKNGKYCYMSRHYNGWYFSSIPNGAILPMNKRDISNLKILYNIPYCREDNCGKPTYNNHKPSKSSKSKEEVESKPSKEVPVTFTPREYFGGTNYYMGELIYMNIGDLYQVASDFKSSRNEPSRQENMQTDIQRGYLVSIK